MTKHSFSYIEQIRSSKNLGDLKPYLQAAIELEHATLPPYLTAKFSLEHGKNQQIREVLRQIIKEEMLHMTIAANILNAVGGTPQIYTDNFVPNYPSPLPFQMKNNLQVGLTKYTLEQVKDVFMVMEEPDEIIQIEGSSSQNTAAIDKSIGEFYIALSDKLKQLSTDKNLPGNPENQVVSKFYPSHELFPIITADDAIKAIDIIIEQGEGSQSVPLNIDGEMAHYYKFLELYEQKPIVKDQNNVFSLGDTPISFDASAVHNIYPNTKKAMLPEGSKAWRLLNNFNEIYGQILLTLQWAFNGHPEKMDQSIGLMFHLQLIGEKLCKMPFPGKEGVNLGPSFECSTLPLRGLKKAGEY